MFVGYASEKNLNKTIFFVSNQILSIEKRVRPDSPDQQLVGTFGRVYLKDHNYGWFKRP